MGQSKYKRRTHQQSNKLVSRPGLLKVGAVALVLVVIVGAAILFAPSNQADTPADFVPEVLGAPRVAVAQEIVDFGAVKYDNPVEAVFRVRNVGDEVLRILDAEPPLEVVEGCCPPRAIISSQTINPGAEAIIMVRFAMHEGMGGPHDFRVHLNTNDPEEPHKELVILSNWIP